MTAVLTARPVLVTLAIALALATYVLWSFAAGAGKLTAAASLLAPRSQGASPSP